MYCQKCGSEARDDANFCWNCGFHINPTRTRQEDKCWEYCETYQKPPSPGDIHAGTMNTILGIQRKPASSKDDDWIANAVGKNGEFIAGTANSPTVLLAKLLKDGWEPINRGDSFGIYRLKRLK